jgi:hypothetical protein
LIDTSSLSMSYRHGSTHQYVICSLNSSGVAIDTLVPLIVCA